MATSADYNSPSPSSNGTGSQPSSPSDTTHLMSNAVLQRNASSGAERRVFMSPRHMNRPSTSMRRFPSPRILARAHSQSPPKPTLLFRSVSEDLINSNWGSPSLLQDGPPKSSSMIVDTSVPVGTENQRLNRENVIGSSSRHVRTPATNGTKPLAPSRSASILSDVRVGGLLSRSSTRRSFGREWTRSHWEKVRDLEQESERARRCSKLSSGFAPLMVFGGLVFICIGVSATTNTGKDQEKLKKLSAAPMVMGVFMLALGMFLIGSWFGCRRRAKGLEQQLLHGSRRGSIDNNLVQNLISKLYNGAALNRRQASSPTLPGVTLDGVNVLKAQPTAEVRNEAHRHVASSSAGCCSQCGASNATAHAILETSI